MPLQGTSVQEFTWPGLKLVGAGGKVAKGTFVTVAEVDEKTVRLDGGQAFSHAELLRQTRLCHAITYASCQGLTLRGPFGFWTAERSISTCGTSMSGPAGPRARSCSACCRMIWATWRLAPGRFGQPGGWLQDVWLIYEDLRK